MYHDFNYKAVLASSQRANWHLDDVIGEGAALDFMRPFLPETLARTRGIGISNEDRLVLNHIRGHEYLCMFGLVEEFILPFVLDHARPQLDSDDYRIRALLQFAGEEAKHIQLFKRFHDMFVASFGTECEVVGPAAALGAEVLRHDPLAVALVILQIEWMTQSHYVDSVRDDEGIDPLFASLLKHHWMEEAQHARLDTLMVDALVEGREEAGIQSAIDEYLEIGAFLDQCFKAQTQFNLAALERATGRTLGPETRERFLADQHQALRWTYIGSGMVHPKFRATLASISPAARDRIAAVAPAFA